MKSLLILGRQPALGLAELESLFGADTIKPVGRDAALLDIDAKDVPFLRLGGSIKLARVLTTLDSTNWRAVEQHLNENIAHHLQYVPEGKFRLGLSAYGLQVHPQEINATGLRLKKLIKAEGRSVRIVPNKSTALNSAQVLHNQLTSPTGWEIIAVRFGQKIVLAQTYAEQNIEAYARRDQERPFRDAKVGMLPPKLAQIIINLATSLEIVPNKIIDAFDETYARPFHLLDPFCGTGVVLQEALLMGYNSVLGSDKDIRMIEYTGKNITWLKTHFSLPEEVIYEAYLGDATTMIWREFEAVACETYLGKPLSSLPPRQVLDGIMAECDDLHQKFLKNIGNQIQSGTRLCLAVPAWHINRKKPLRLDAGRGGGEKRTEPYNKYGEGVSHPTTKSSARTVSSATASGSWQADGAQGFLHLKTLANLDKLGYTRLSFVHARTEDLIYYREGQVVARELIILEKK